jgi:hypothetical protein
MKKANQGNLVRLTTPQIILEEITDGKVVHSVATGIRATRMDLNPPRSYEWIEGDAWLDMQTGDVVTSDMAGIKMGKL